MSYVGRRFVPQSTIDRRVQRKDDRCARELKRRMAQAALDLRQPAPVDEPRDDDDQDDREELSGSTCSAGCGFCGRCS